MGAVASQLGTGPGLSVPRSEGAGPAGHRGGPFPRRPGGLRRHPGRGPLHPAPPPSPGPRRARGQLPPAAVLTRLLPGSREQASAAGRVGGGALSHSAVPGSCEEALTCVAPAGAGSWGPFCPPPPLPARGGIQTLRPRCGGCGERLAGCLVSSLVLPSLAARRGRGWAGPAAGGEGGSENSRRSSAWLIILPPAPQPPPHLLGPPSGSPDTCPRTTRARRGLGAPPQATLMVCNPQGPRTGPGSPGQWLSVLSSHGAPGAAFTPAPPLKKYFY